jgi:membrane dipeptidase
MKNASLTVNLHSDFLAAAVHRFRETGDCLFLRRYGERLRAGGLRAVFCAVGGDTDFWFPVGYDETIESFRLSARLGDVCGQPFRIVRSSEDLDAARDQEAVALVLGLEGGGALEGRIERVEALYQEGLRWLGLTWNVKNELGDGCGEAQNRGLTSFGEEAIQRANHLGIVVDLAHTSRATFEDAAAACAAPFIVSHSNAASLCPHPRNLTDAQIRAVARSGGVVGINFFPRLLCADRTPVWQDIERHVRYVADLVGVDHVALGPDFIDFPGELILEELARSGLDYGARADYPAGFSDDACFPEVTRCLLGGGMAEGDVRKILGENVLRVMVEVEERAALSSSRGGRGGSGGSQTARRGDSRGSSR